MANPIQKVIQGFVYGLGAGIIGFATDILTGAMFEAFTPFNPLIPLWGLVFAVVTFLAGIAEAYLTGLFFSLGIISAGVLLNDFVTIASGFISIAGLVISLVKG